MKSVVLSEVSRRDELRQQRLILFGTLAAAVAVFYLVRLIAGGEPVVRLGGPAAAAALVRPLDRVLVPVVAVGMLSAGFLLLRGVTYRSACRMAALAAFTYAVTVAARPFSLESVLGNAVAQSGNVTPWLLVLAVLALPQSRLSRRLRVATVATGLGFPALMAALHIVTFSAASAGDQLWLARHALAGTVADMGTAVAVAVALGLLLRAYRRARTAHTREPILWTIGGMLLSLPAYLLLRLPAHAADHAAASGFPAPTGAIADLLLLPLPAFFLVGTRHIPGIDQRRAINRFWAAAIVLAVLLLFVTIAGDYLQRQIVDSYELGDRVAAYLVLSPLFVALLALHAWLVRVFDRTGGAGPEQAPTRGSRDGSRGVRDLRVLTRALHRSLGGSMSAAAGALSALESELEAERDGSRPPDAAPVRLPRGALDSIRGFRRTALTVLAALRRLDAGTRAGGAVVEVQVSDLFAAAYRRAGRRSELRVELTDGGDLVVACDPAELARALAELLINAEEAGVRRRSRITMGAREHGNDTVIEVQDSGARPLGPGRSRVFEPFYSTKPGHDGLGLYISRVLIEHNGGSLVLERGSEGTCAVVTLPAARS